jgi:hypothetical protein
VALLFLTLVALGCEHGDPYQVSGESPLTTPLSSTLPVQLTFDRGMDRFATWSLDGQSIWYSFQPESRPDGDVCLATLPATGGTRTGYCPSSTAQQADRDAYDRATPGPDGQLLYGHYTSHIGMLTLYLGSLDLATVDAPLAGRSLLSLPNNIDGIGFNHVGRIHWLTRDHVILVAEDETAVPHCAACAKFDTVFIGYTLLDARITPDGATFTRIQGTLHANDFTMSAAGDSIYFTRSDDPDNPTGRDLTISTVPVGGGTPRILYTSSGAVYSLSRAGPLLVIALRDHVASLDLATGTVNPLGNKGLNGARGYGTVTASSDGCRLLAEFGRPRDITFETNVFLLPTGLTGCAP